MSFGRSKNNSRVYQSLRESSQHEVRTSQSSISTSLLQRSSSHRSFQASTSLTNVATNNFSRSSSRGTPSTHSTNKPDNVPLSSSHIATTSSNSSGGLFFSFPANMPTPKQNVLIPKFVPQKSNKKGYALILNHHKYTIKQVGTRDGTHYDAAELEKVFKYFSIESKVKDDLKLSEIRQKIIQLRKKDFSKYECLIVVVLTHGDQGQVLYAKDKSYNFITEIEDVLSIENKTLHDKPKIFVIQACRGNVKMPVIEADSTQNKKLQSTVAKRNIFKCYATYEGNVAYRNTELGAIFIQTFCQKLKEMEYETIYNVMMKVIDEVSKDTEHPQVPTVESTMFEQFCFGNLLK